MKRLVATLLCLGLVGICGCSTQVRHVRAAPPAETAEPMVVLEDLSDPIPPSGNAHVGAPTLPPGSGALEYIVQPGDTLYGLALRHYGDGSRWPEIVAANRPALSNPGDLRVGMRIVIPPR